MTNRHEEHYKIANSLGLGRAFTRLEFNRLYRQEFPKRISPPNPSDYCINLDQKVAKYFPKFLRWLGRSRYEFIDEKKLPASAKRGASAT